MMQKLSEYIPRPWKSSGEIGMMQVESGSTLELVKKSDQTIAKLNLFHILEQGNLLCFLKKYKDDLRDKVNKLDQNKHSLLHHAVRGRQADVVKQLVLLGADVNTRNPNGATPFHFACRYLGPCVDQDVTLDILKALASGNKFDVYNQDWSGSSGLHHAATKGNITAVKFILDNSASNYSKIDLRDKLGNTSLHKAALEGKANIADYLLRHGADIKCICNFHQNAIHKAALNGYANVVEVIRKFDKESYKELMQHKDIGKSTVLHLAVYGGSIDIVQMLKELGYLETQLKQKNESGETALHRAARRNLTTFINIFLDHGADVNSENSKGQTPLHIASENGHKEAVNALIRDEINLQPRSCTKLNCKDNYYQTPLMAALIKGDESVFNVLNEAGAMIDVKNNRGQNLIHILVEHNKLQLLDDILNKITKERIYELLNDNDFMEENPLHIAARVGNLKEIWSILKAFISKDEYAQLLKVKNDYEESPFHIATKSGNIELMSEIINAFPESVYQLAKDGNTASHLAAKHNQPVSLQLLLEKNLELTPFNAHFKTPLDCAAEAGSKECIKILLSSGYVLIRTSTSNNFNENNESRTLPNNPLHLAAKNGHHDIVKILLDEGADITVKDLEGKTAMQLALENDKKSVVEVILSSSSWEQSLRTAFLEKENEKILTTPIRILIKNYPDLAEMVLDRCSNERNGDLFFSIEFIEDNYLIKSKSETSEFDFIDDDDYLENNYEESTDLSKMIHPMELMLNERQENLLKHPLTIALTKFKWSTYGRCLFIFEAVIYTLFLATFSAYSFLTLKDAKIKSANKTLNETATKDLCVGLENWFLPTITTIKGLSMFFIILCFNFELSKFTSCKKYRTTLALKLSIYISVFSWYLVYHEVDECSDSVSYKWPVCAILLAASTLNLLRYFKFYSFYGVFIIMFFKILYIVIKLCAMIIIFILAFCMSFYILLRENDAFSDFRFAFLKTILMFTGEVEFAELFSAESRESLQFQPVIIALVIIFIIVMSIVLINMLIGLAVDNISEIQADAELQRLCSEIQLVLDIRRRLFSWLRTKMSKEAKMKVITIKQKKSLLSFLRIGHIMSYDTIRQNYLRRREFCAGLEKSKRL